MRGGQAGDGPKVVTLDDPRATDPRLTGGKAAALATATARGLPVLPGFVITTVATAPDGPDPLGPEVEAAWRKLSRDGRRALVVRSSSTAEDLADSSMAGRYESVVGVEGWESFTDAVGVVLASAEQAAAGGAALAGDEPLAVLVQPLLDSAVGGVAFGVEPVSGRTDRIIVVASEQGPDAVVSGRVEAARYVLERDGTYVEAERNHGELSRRRLRALAQLVGEVAEVFGGHQDVEWAFDRRGTLTLLQSRPVTTEVAGIPEGPVLGPGPVSETFPDPIATLEQDLWVEPLREAFVQALTLAGAATQAELEASPVVACIDGRVIVDLELVGMVPRRSATSRLDPRRKLRRLRGAWRIGRLRAALPGLAEDVVNQADDALAGVPALDTLSDRQLLALLDRGAVALIAIHAQEVLMGQLIAPDAGRLTGTSVALRVLAHAREQGIPDEEIAARHPVVLTLTGPRIGSGNVLPRSVTAPPWKPGAEHEHAAVLREALRLRVRWLHELMARAAWALGERLADRGALEDPSLVRWLHRDEVGAMMLRGEPAPADLGARSAGGGGGRLPARFRLSDTGRPIPVNRRSESGGTGAGGGTGRGPVVHDPAEVEDGAVLVVSSLEPSLAPVLPRLGGLVSETGSVLAHLAILARESEVATVVGMAGAVERFEPGCIVTVDGVEGEVEVVEGE